MIDLSAPPRPPSRAVQEARQELATLRGRRPSAALAQLQQTNSEGWLTTYTDMVTLLLTLFIFLVAMSDFHQDPAAKPELDTPTSEGVIIYEEGEQPHRFQPAIVPMVESGKPGPPPASPDLVPAETVPPAMEWLRDRAAELEKFALHHDLAQGMTVERTERAVVIQLREGILFASARADLTPTGQAVVRRLADLLAGMPGEIEVEGHTDSIPIDTPRFPSNWELSAARAAAVARKLIDNGVPASRLKAIGYADTRPVAGNGTTEGRAANRRVALLLLARSVEEGEPR